MELEWLVFGLKTDDKVSEVLGKFHVLGLIMPSFIEEGSYTMRRLHRYPKATPLERHRARGRATRA
jgi:hypothetical protein